MNAFWGWLQSTFFFNITLVLAIVGLITAFFQWRKSKTDAEAFRQQLISIMHHAEGIATELRNIGAMPPLPSFSSVIDVVKTVNAIHQNTESLFFGLMETKIGGRSLKDDIDSRYSQWVDLEFQRKLWALEQWLSKQHKENPDVVVSVNKSMERKNFFKMIISNVKNSINYLLSSD